MKRYAIDIRSVAEYRNLVVSATRAARGKRLRKDVVHFFEKFDDNINSLGRNIIDGRAPVGKFRQFRIHDPKERIIHAACFEDRVLHHALMNHAGPVLERAMVDTSFACRPKKGIHAAVNRVQNSIRKYPWYVRIFEVEVQEMTRVTITGLSWNSRENGTRFFINDFICCKKKMIPGMQVGGAEP